MTTTYSIFPAVGIARVGNSTDAFYIGPEEANGLPIMPDGSAFTPADFRDANGALRRQAARFRIFRSVDGGPQEEVTLASVGVSSINWTAHLANKKSSWYAFQTYKGEDGYAPNHPLRNASETSLAERRALIIDAGPRTISGANAPAETFSRDSIPDGYPGSFPPETLKPYAIDTIGELQTDADGRLLVLGGLGHSGSKIDPPSIDAYANNDGWWDDTADGPISATLQTDDGEITVSGAWVMVAPPSYAPQIANLVTLYDTIFDVVVRKQGARPDIFAAGLWKSGADGFLPNFERDIKPIFERAQFYPWVTAIPPKPHSFDYGRMGNTDKALNGFRKYYLDFIRPPGGENVLTNATTGATMMPYLAGDDGIGVSAPGSVTAGTSKYLRLTDTQYFYLQQWSEGWFTNDAAEPEQPGDALTRGVLENCVGGAFSPGIEMTWISRNPAIYESPFRIKARVNPPAPLSLGYTPELGMEPGDVSRYMACPWQADFNECSSQPIEGRILWWWPAQRPEFVYLPPEENGGAALGPQVSWIGTVYNQNAADYISFSDDIEMVEHWHELGFVYNISETDKPHFVEVNRQLPRAPGSSGATGPNQAAIKKSIT